MAEMWLLPLKKKKILLSQRGLFSSITQVVSIVLYGDILHIFYKAVASTTENFSLLGMEVALKKIKIRKKRQKKNGKYRHENF